MAVRGNCFVIMPFRKELHYMYLYMKEHIEDKFPLTCVRGDSNFTTDTILEKILQDITEADVLIADCSGRNANVFYELGMAHVLGKPVILITSDEVEEAPTDIKSFEFIKYQLDDHKGFFDKLDLALQGVLGEDYEELYTLAQNLYQEYCTQTGFQRQKASKEEFIMQIATHERSAGMLDIEDEKVTAKAIIPAIIAGELDLDLSVDVAQWIDNRWLDPVDDDA